MQEGANRSLSETGDGQYHSIFDSAADGLITVVSANSEERISDAVQSILQIDQTRLTI